MEQALSFKVMRWCHSFEIENTLVEQVVEELVANQAGGVGEVQNMEMQVLACYGFEDFFVIVGQHSELERDRQNL